MYSGLLKITVNWEISSVIIERIFRELLDNLKLLFKKYLFTVTWLVG